MSRYIVAMKEGSRDPSWWLKLHGTFFVSAKMHPSSRFLSNIAINVAEYMFDVGVQTSVIMISRTTLSHPLFGEYNTLIYFLFFFEQIIIFFFFKLKCKIKAEEILSVN